jgi:hypothetical protein
MQNNFSQALKLLFNPETILPFLVGSLALAVLGNALYDMLTALVGATLPGFLQVGAIALLILIASAVLLNWKLSQRLAKLNVDIPIEVQQKALELKYKGLILLVSNLETCETAIQFHLPELRRCWLICSTTTINYAYQLQRRFPQPRFDQPLVINDIYDPLAFRDCIHGIYTMRLPKGWQESDVITDYTGMTSHASVGAVLACVKTHRPLQYTPAKLDAQGKPIGSLNPIKVYLDIKNC